MEFDFDKMLPKVVKYVKPVLKHKSYFNMHKSAGNATDREKASNLALTLEYNPKNPEIKTNPYLNRKKKKEQHAKFDLLSLYQTG